MVLLSNCQDFSKSSREYAALPQKVDYNFHIRPILADRCFSCHGPDEAARKANLRLDLEEHAYARLKNKRKAIHPGSPKKSEVWHRIHEEDSDIKMPPEESGLALSNYEKELITKWIRQGGVYEGHWAFQPLVKPALPNISQSVSTLDEIDQFVLSQLRNRGLDFSPEASKEQLLRRVTFDLTGLPPTIEELDSFLADTSPKAYEDAVDRLLESHAYAERMTMDWLDLARYADSQGLHSDGWRSMYPWRDWVIKAFQNNMPFDEFVTLQLAGDLLPNPQREDLVATGFNRNHKTTAEGGVVDEEYRMEYVHDRVATTATVFMGMTMECARCHDHKYDPISQEEYYQFFAFFNQVDELGLSGDDGNAGPNLLLPSVSTQTQLAAIQAEIERKESKIALSENALAEQMDFISKLKDPAAIQTDLNIHLPFENIVKDQLDNHPDTKLTGGLAIVSSDRDKVLELNGEYEYVTIKNQGLFEQNQPFSGSIWIHPNKLSTTQTIVGNSGSKGVFWRGWDLYLDSSNRLNFRLIHALPHDVIHVQTVEPVAVDEWTHVAFVYSGNGRAEGVALYIDGQEQKTEVVYDNLERTIYPMSFSKQRAQTPLRLGKSYRAFTGEYGIYEGLMDDFYLFSRPLSALEVSELAERSTVVESLAQFQQSNNPENNALLETWLHRNKHPLEKEIEELRGKKIAMLDTVPEVMIMEEVKKPRDTYVLHRGNYDEPTSKVYPGTPTTILPFEDDLEMSRLGLAEWLLQPNHPLTSRVAVNRFWQQFFGQGLVGTSHDFGLQGSLPSHPELLDWLATNFVESGWDVKGLLKEIVLSKTYRQSSHTSQELREIDPDNIWLARGPSYRFPAEMIRDNALASSGLLDHVLGGPSVKPIQPEGLWKEKTSSTYLLRAYEADEGSARYRRSMYTFVRRTSPHPAMTAFDAPNRSICTSQRQQTNTPMQALVLLNDPQFVEASRTLAQKLLQEDLSIENQITKAFRLLTSGLPSTNQLDELVRLYEEEENRFRKDPDSAEQFLSIGQYASDATLEPSRLASMALIVNTIMNFDGFYTKR